MNSATCCPIAAGASSLLPVEAGWYSGAYERLRACVTGQAGARAAGLGLVLQEGVPGWLKAFGREPVGAAGGRGLSVMSRLEPTRIESRPCMGTAIPPEILPVSQHADVTLLLASLVMSTQRKGPAFPVAIQPGFRGGLA